MVTLLPDDNDYNWVKHPKTSSILVLTHLRMEGRGLEEAIAKVKNDSKLMAKHMSDTSTTKCRPEAAQRKEPLSPVRESPSPANFCGERGVKNGFVGSDEGDKVKSGGGVGSVIYRVAVELHCWMDWKNWRRMQKQVGGATPLLGWRWWRWLNVGE